MAIRPRTLGASVSPVLVGTALAAHDGFARPLPALAALAGALLIQAGTNLANDAADFARGADTAARLGPPRAVQSGLLSPGRVWVGAAVAFAAAAAIGLYLVSLAGAPILVLGVTSIAAGVLYTSGPFPLAYVGLGDVFVLAFFGLAAVAGTYYVQTLAISPAVVALGVSEGTLAVAILALNNLRDIETDRLAGKRTLAVRMGESPARRYYAALVVLAFAIPIALVARGLLPPPALGVILASPLAVQPLRAVLGGQRGSRLNPVLWLTGRLQLAHAAALAAGLLIA